MRKSFLLLSACCFALGLGGVACSDDDGDRCGDGIRQPGEECDGYDIPTDCDYEGFMGGTIGCTASCTIDVSMCHNCGDGIKDADEECDASDFGSSTCQTEGYDYGDLSCDANCLIDNDGCYDSGCDVADFTSLDASAMTDNVEYYYSELVSDTGLHYILEIDTYDDGGGVLEGAHSLGVGDDAYYNECFYCVSLYQCTDSACTDADTLFFATDGTLYLDTLGMAGGLFEGSLEYASFAEWDGINDEPVTGGDCIDLLDWSVDATLIQANW